MNRHSALPMALANDIVLKPSLTKCNLSLLLSQSLSTHQAIFIYIFYFFELLYENETLREQRCYWNVHIEMASQSVVIFTHLSMTANLISPLSLTWPFMQSE